MIAVSDDLLALPNVDAALFAVPDISVSSVEIRDVAIPDALQHAMSRQALAERETKARVILGSAEAPIAGKFVEAADIYASHPGAL